MEENKSTLKIYVGDKLGIPTELIPYWEIHTDECMLYELLDDEDIHESYKDGLNNRDIYQISSDREAPWAHELRSLDTFDVLYTDDGSLERLFSNIPIYLFGSWLSMQELQNKNHNEAIGDIYLISNPGFRSTRAFHISAHHQIMSACALRNIFIQGSHTCKVVIGNDRFHSEITDDMIVEVLDDKEECEEEEYE